MPAAPSPTSRPTVGFFFFFSSSPFFPPSHRIQYFSEESQATLVAQEKLFQALKLAAEKHSDIEIKRHVARGLANFALYDTNQAKMIPLIPLLVTLGQLDSTDIQRHVVRAIDNLLAAEVVDVRPYMREAKVDEFLRMLADQKKGSGDDTSKRALNALDKFNMDQESATEDLKWSTAETGGMMSTASASALQSRENSHDDLHQMSMSQDISATAGENGGNDQSATEEGEDEDH